MEEPPSRCAPRQPALLALALAPKTLTFNPAARQRALLRQLELLEPLGGRPLLLGGDAVLVFNGAAVGVARVDDCVCVVRAWPHAHRLTVQQLRPPWAWRLTRCARARARARAADGRADEPRLPAGAPDGGNQG